jgi:apolipoprotein N-acyltransferase
MALPLICYEAIFARDLRAAPERAGWILQITNDAWFGTFSGPQQHLAQARMRAIEMGLPFVRAANTGISAVIAPDGRVVASLGLGRAGHIDAALPAAWPETPYARWGNLPLTLMLLCGGSGLILLRRRRIVIDAGAGRM